MKAKREAMVDIQNSLDAVSPEFKEHVSNQIQMAKNTKVNYNARYVVDFLF